FEPARTPFDWLSRDPAVIDAFINDPLCFAELMPPAQASFLAAASRLSDPAGLRSIRSDLPLYLFSGSDDPVGQRLEGVRLLIERYRKAAWTTSHTISTLVDGTRCSTRSTARRSGRACLVGWRRRWNERRLGQ